MIEIRVLLFTDQRLVELRDSNEELEELKRLSDEKSAAKQQLEQQLQEVDSGRSSSQQQLEQVTAAKGNLEKELLSLKV